MKKIVWILIIALLIVSACKKKGEFTIHSSGLPYRFIETNPNGQSPEPGDILVLSIKYFNEDNTLIDGSDFYRMQMTKPTYQGDLHTGLSLLQVGDSVCFKLEAADYYEKTRKRDMPKEFQQGDPIFVHLRLKNIISGATLSKERRSAYHTDEAQELQLLKDYLERTNVQVEPLATGVYVIPLSEGNGVFPKQGQKIITHYTGKTIDGRVFDTSLEKGRPIEFILGRGEVISGWDIAFRHISKGEKARLIIPSKLAYGKDGRGNVILPYSTLIFEIELIDIE